jgi:opacity protein-like surface antigen
VKQLLLILLFISSLYADAKIYIGLNAGGFSESLHEIDAKSSSEMATFKIAYGDRKAYAVEFSIDYLQNDSKIFSSSKDVSTDGNKIGFNINLMKSFDFDIYVLPYVKVGFGTGYLDIQRELQDSISYGSFQGSLGMFLPVNEHFDFEVGYEIRENTYEAIDSIDTKTAYNSTIQIAYVGVNYRF